jgi:hypothetical protein
MPVQRTIQYLQRYKSGAVFWNGPGKGYDNYIPEGSIVTIYRAQDRGLFQVVGFKMRACRMYAKLIGENERGCSHVLVSNLIPAHESGNHAASRFIGG